MIHQPFCVIFRLLSSKGFHTIVLTLLVVFAVASPASVPRRKVEIAVCNQLLNQLGAPSTFEAARSAGINWIEIDVREDLSCPGLMVGQDRPYSLATDSSAQKTRSDAEAKGIGIAALVAAIELDFASETRAGAPEWSKTLIKRARSMGVGLVYFPVVTNDFTKMTAPDGAVIARTESILRELVPLARESGVRIAIENLSVYWNRPQVLEGLLSRFDPKDLGLCLDPVNLYWFGHPLAAVHRFSESFFPWTVHFHVKDLAYPVSKKKGGRAPGWKYDEYAVPVGKGDLDFERLLLLLTSSGYQGFVAIEDDSLGKFKPEERLLVLQSDVRHLERILYGGPSDLELKSR